MILSLSQRCGCPQIGFEGPKLVLVIMLMMMRRRMMRRRRMRRRRRRPMISGTSQASTTVEASLVDDSRPLATPQILLSVCLCICLFPFVFVFVFVLVFILYPCLSICLYPQPSSLYLSFHIFPTTPQILFFICLIVLIFIKFELNYYYLTDYLRSKS